MMNSLALYFTFVVTCIFQPMTVTLLLNSVVIFYILSRLQHARLVFRGLRQPTDTKA